MIEEHIAKLREHQHYCWKMAEVFLNNADAHGIHDMGVEIQALQLAIRELEKLK